jgi:chemotaxis signal transduction protein
MGEQPTGTTGKTGTLDSQQALLKKRAARLAQCPPQAQHIQASVIVFALDGPNGNDRWAVTLTQVVRLIQLAGLRSLPKVPALVRGVLHHQGKLLTVLDLGLLLGRGPAELGPAARVLVVAVPASASANGAAGDQADSQVGLLVSVVLGVETPSSALQPPLGAQPGLAGHWGDLALVDLEALLRQQGEYFSAWAARG